MKFVHFWPGEKYNVYLSSQVSNVEGGERSLLCDLHNNHITTSQGRAQLPGLHKQGEVPL